MSFFNSQLAVKYVCTCGKLKPISKIYFCRYCSAIRCSFCVSHEIDARYCPNCLENLPAAEAWMKNNCCSSCFICPVCHLNLTTRATSVKTKEASESSEKEESKPETKKLYYLCCFNCYWTSRDVGIPDQTTASASWPEFENPQVARINELIEYYKAVSTNDKIINEKKNPSTRKNYSHLSGMSAAMMRRKVGFSLYQGSQFSLPGFQEIRKLPKIEPSTSTSDVSDLPSDIFTKVPDLTEVTTLDQRLGIPGLQCLKTTELKPCKKLLLTKRSQRCRECEHNVAKPEFHPSSIKFKILLSAYDHIPNVSIKKCEPLQPGEESDLIIHLVNPTPHQVTVTFLPFDTEIKKKPPPEEETPPAKESTEGTDDLTQAKKRTPLKIDHLVKVEPRPVNIKFTGVPILPERPVVIPCRDVAAEFDDTTENLIFNDDKKVVLWRKMNQVLMKFPVKPEESLQPDSEVVIGFMISHTYVNTLIQDKTHQEIDHQVKIVLTAGKIVS